MNIKQSRFIALITALAVIFSVMPTVLADNASDKPTVTIVGSSIKKDDNYFELGIEVTPAQNSSFLSVGVTLAYDRDLLTPVAWDDNGTEPPIGESWTDITAIPALCPAGISGKTVFAYNETKIGATPQPAATTEPSTEPEPEQSDEPVPTPDEGGELEAQDDETVETPGGTPTEAPTEAPETTPTAAPGATPEAEYIPPYEHTGYLYISAEAPKKLTKKEVAELNGVVATAKPTEAPTPAPTEETGGDPTAEPTASPEVASRAAQDYTPNRVVTMRFKYAAGKKQAVLNGFANGTVVTLAPDAVAAESPAGQQAMYCTGEEKINLDKDPDRVVEYYYADAGEDTLGIKYDFPMDKPELKLTELANGSNAGGSDPSKFSAIVFYEWDKKTVLGAVVVDSSADTESINESVAAFTQTFMPDTITNADGTTARPDMAAWNDEKAYNCVTYDTNYIFTSHEGYSFGKWVLFNSDAYTIYGTNHNFADSPVNVSAIEAPEDIDYAAITPEEWKTGLILAAAYISNKYMDDSVPLTAAEGRTAAKCNYTISNTTDPTERYFGYFNNMNYAVRFKVRRGNERDGRFYPVPRVRQAAVRVVFNAGSMSITSLVNIDDVDEQMVEVAAPANATFVSATVIDIGGMENWVDTSAPRSVTQSFYAKYQAGQPMGELGYSLYGFIDSCNGDIAQKKSLAVAAWNSLKIPLSASTPVYWEGVTDKKTIANIRKWANTYLQAAYDAKYAKAVADKKAELGIAVDADLPADKMPPQAAGYLSQMEMGAAIQFNDYTRTADVTIVQSN